MEAINVKNLSFRYPEADDYALENISFSVKQGEFVTLCGVSGSGKSTLLRHLKPALAPHGKISGEVLINDREISRLSQREQTEIIGFVLQSPDNQIVTDKVWHELAFGLESLGCTKEQISRRVAETASFFGIQNYFEADVSTLSGGQKQLLNLASVMAMQPEILLLDEPTAQLDPIAAADFLSCLQRINRELGTTVLITEHRLEDVLPVSDRVLVLENGTLISDDIPSRTGKNLKRESSACFMSLPAPMRIWDAVDNGDNDCPVTVAQGREWLENYGKTHDLLSLYPENKNESSDLAIELKKVWFRYEKGSPDVIKDLSFQIRHGEFITIMGGNGTGKSTLLSLISGTNHPYRGKTNSNFELCLALPQNPQSVLNGKSVGETLWEVLEGTDLGITEQEKRISSVVGKCHLERLIDRHPFDLSGGEMQKVALAKLLLLQPDVLLLDEPTKGLDAQFKAEFARMIKSLTDRGSSVVMVSHDIEFCAKYSDRCMLMFNGEVTASGTPREFFTQNSFYVTSSARMARGVIPGAITAEDVIYCCTGKISDEKPPKDDDEIFFQVEKKKTDKKKLPVWKKVLGISGAVLLLLGILINLKTVVLPFFPDSLWFNFSIIAIPVLMLMASIGSLPGKSERLTFEKGKLRKRTIVSVAIVLLFIPLTIYIGSVFLYDQKYLFISLLVLLECMLPFFLVFEGRKPQARELILIAVLCALAVAGRTAFAALPQIKPVLALVIISGAALGGETGFIVGATSMLVSNMYFGQGAWTPWQMFAAGLIGLISGVLFQKGLMARHRGLISVFGFIVTITVYGGIMNFSSLVLSHLEINTATVITFYAQGLPYDIIHAFSTAAFLFFLSEPMLEKLERMKTKYGLIEKAPAVIRSKK